MDLEFKTVNEYNSKKFMSNVSFKQCNSKSMQQHIDKKKCF